MSSLLVVIVAYRADVHLAGCLSELGAEAAVTVVDNDTASTQTRQIAERAGATYVAAPSNLGFAGGVNLALQQTWDGLSDVLLLNPDARIDAAGIERLHEALRNGDPRCAAVSACLVDESGTLQRVEWPFPSPAHAWLEAFGLARLWAGPSFLVGAVLMLRAAALTEVGAFDERYFLYAEETDWQWRALRAGWSLRTVDDVVAIHAGGASSSNVELRDRLFHASKEIYTRKWHGRAGWTILRVACVLAAARRSLYGSAVDRSIGRRALRSYVRGPVRAAASVGAVSPR